MNLPPAPFPIVTEAPANPGLRRACRLLAIVHELHKAGYQRLRISAGMSPSGCDWRCDITPADNIRANGWELLEPGAGVATYQTGDEDRFFGWKDARGKTARELAQLFVERHPDIVARALGRDRPYIGWFVEMLGAAEHGELPVFFSGEEPEGAAAQWPPSPLRAQPVAPGKWIAHADLVPDLLPSAAASWEDLEAFCLSFDGDAATGGDIEVGVRTIDQVATGLTVASLDQLRTALYFIQRGARWNSDLPIPPEHFRIAQQIIEEIRARLTGRPRVVIQVGGEGGSVEIVGRKSGKNWQYRLVTNEDLHDESPSGPGWIRTWHGVLQQLDRYPWAELFPLEVHPEFRTKVSVALKTRLPADDRSGWENWKRVLG